MSVTLDPPIVIPSGFGTATIDGALSPGEWANAGTTTFNVNLPGGGTAPGTRYVMNDSTNLYLAVEFGATAPNNSASFAFDSDRNGTTSLWDDVLLINPNPIVGFRDEVIAPLGPNAFNGQNDTSLGGTNDGAGAFNNSAGGTIYEFSHPLNSDDNLHDFSLSPGDLIGFNLSIRLLDGNVGADTDVPGPAGNVFDMIALATASGPPTIFGDTSNDLSGHARAAAESIFLPSDVRYVSATLIGDSRALLGHAIGGDDILSGSPFSIAAGPTVIGDAITIADQARGGNDTLGGGNIFGDAIELSGHGRGGNDIISAFARGPSAFGDARTIADHAGGGDDVITASGRFPSIFGDAQTIGDHGTGGNDVMTAGGDVAEACGDAGALTGFSSGGNDSVTAYSLFVSNVSGDAITMTDHAKGGNDIVSGASVFACYLYGDAKSLSGFSIGGNDTVQGLSGNTEMYGDGAELLDHAKGGNDTLISGPYGEQMWGDAETVAPTARTGADIFVFSPPNGQDTINDFERGKDHIDLKAFGFGSFNDVANDIQDTQNGALITFDANDSILVVGVHQLSAGDFILA